MDSDKLNDREHQVLEAIIRNYILSASPTSSRSISKMNGFALSPASIRNVMSDLEENGFITHLHTSAGRIPTDKGYRYYVDRVMTFIELPDSTKSQIREKLVTVEQSDLNVLLAAASQALSKATKQLGVILAPRIINGKFKHLHIFPVESSRYFLNLTIESGIVKTMMIELETTIPLERLEIACRLISSRCYDKTLQQLCEPDTTTFQGIPEFELGIIRLLVPSIKKMVDNDHNDTVYAEGTSNILLQPEFFDRDRIGAIVEIIEEKKLLIHLIETPEEGKKRVVISIGGENNDQLQSFSVIKTTYKVGNMAGSLGVIGPKRMPYPFLVSAVDYTAKLLGELYL